MLSWHIYIIDYNMCKIKFVPFTNKENNTFDTPPFTKFIRKLIYPYSEPL